MLIRFKKGKCQHKHRPDTVTCIRNDGSVTWTQVHRGFVIHDLAHYVVETTLGFENAFFGLVAKGFNIPEFNLPNSTRPFQIPHEAISIEPIVALLQIEHWDSFPEPLLDKDSPELTVGVTSEQIKIMRERLRELVYQWENISHGESMELKFGNI